VKVSPARLIDPNAKGDVADAVNAGQWLQKGGRRHLRLWQPTKYYRRYCRFQRNCEALDMALDTAGELDGLVLEPYRRLGNNFEHVVMAMNHREIEAQAAPAQRLSLAGDPYVAVGRVRIFVAVIGGCVTGLGIPVTHFGARRPVFGSTVAE
jgi:hypothetical protein